MDNVREDRRKNQRRICRGKGRLYIARTPAMKKKFFKVDLFTIQDFSRIAQIYSISFQSKPSY